MKNFIALLCGALFALLSPLTTLAQVGIGTPTPGSTLDVRGSRADNYTRVTTATYALTATDHYVSYNGTAAGTITLPVAGSGTAPYAANFRGRRYTLKNNTVNQALIILPSGSETIDGNTSISLGAAQSVDLVSTGLTGANATWEIVSLNTTAPTGCVPGYILANLPSSGQSVTTPVDVHFISSAQNGLSVNSSTGVFTLVAGNTYLLQAGLHGSGYSAGNTGFIYQWVDANNNPLPGDYGIALSNSYDYTSQQQIVTAIYTPTSTVTVKLRVFFLQNGSATIVSGSFAYIQQLNACTGM